MKKSSLYCVSAALLLLVCGIYSCKKSSPSFDNNTVIETPYSLYFSDSSGTLYVSTNGTSVDHVVFPPDGKPCRSLVTSGNNILWAKDNLYYSSNNGVNFNSSFDSLNTSANADYYVAGATHNGSFALNGLAIDYNQSMLINLPAWGNRLYVATNALTVNGGSDFLGSVHSDNNGEPGGWGTDGYRVDTVYNTHGVITGYTSYVGVTPVQMTTFTQLTNGYLCALAYETKGNISAGTTVRYVRNFYKTAKDENTAEHKWQENTANPDRVASLSSAGSLGSKPLPPSVAEGMKDTSFFTLGHLNDELIAIDQKGEYGAWYSDDYGANWYKFTGLPAGVPLLCVNAPFEQVALIGTEGQGVYELNLNTHSWQPSNTGLGKNSVVRNISFHSNTYKNGTTQQYIYLATNQGIYQSVNGGVSWSLTIAGNYTDVY